MTMTESRPAAPADLEPVAAESRSLIDSADHKQLGLVLIGAGLLFLVVAGALALVLRGELVDDGVQIVGNEFGRLFSMHATFATVLFLGPVFLGLGTFVVPLQIGAPRVAFPRLHAFATWAYVLGGVLLAASYVVGPPAGGGLSLVNPIPPAVGDEATAATELWIGSLGMIAVATLLLCVSLVVTIGKLRAPGMTLARLPLFSWGILTTAGALILSTPVFLAGLLLLYIDQHAGGTFFADPASQAIWQHLLWLFGRPEAYLLGLPGLAAACEIVTLRTRKPLDPYFVARGALAAAAIFSFGVWASGTAVMDAVVLPAHSGVASAIIAPVGVVVLLWLNSLRSPSFSFHASLLHVAGFLALVGLGVAAAGIAGLKEVDGGTAWTTGFIHTAVFGAPTLLAFGALHHWAPKLIGRPLNAGLGALEALALTGGFAISGLASFFLGYEGMPAHVKDFAGDDLGGLNLLAAVGGVVVVGGVVLFLVNVLSTLARKTPAQPDPWNGLTLEWAAPWPTPAHNFEAVDDVRSLTPLADGGDR